MGKIGIFSGTFDPVHNGHINFALAAITQMDLKKVIFLPERNPRGKLGVEDFRHRLKMLKIATTAHKALQVLQLEDKYFTASQTLPQLKKLFPDDELVLLVGSDTVKTFLYRWPGLEEILKHMQLAIYIRANETRQKMEDILVSLNLPFNAQIIVSTGFDDVSATVVRSGQLNHVPQNLRQYIIEQDLYK